MTESEFDAALIAAAFRLAADDGWQRVTVSAACHAAGLPIAEARVRFPTRGHILLRFGQLADQFALTDASDDGPPRDRLFDLLMRRFDALNAHREGVKALLRALPFDLRTALLLACSTRNSMRWMLEASGITATGLRGDIQAKGLMAVWLWGVRAWERDESADLSQTMAAVDSGLGRAEWLAGLLGRVRPEEGVTASASDDVAASTPVQAQPDPQPIVETSPQPDEAGGPPEEPPE
jgi:ubiquinone biosynthesis protein COQ9